MSIACDSSCLAGCRPLATWCCASKLQVPRRDKSTDRARLAPRGSAVALGRCSSKLSCASPTTASLLHLEPQKTPQLFLQHGRRNRPKCGRKDGVLHLQGGHGGADLRGHAPEGEPAARHLRLWLRVALGRAVACDCAGLQRPRYHCAGPVRNRKDGHLLHLHPPGHRHGSARDTGYVETRSPGRADTNGVQHLSSHPRANWPPRSSPSSWVLATT
jgi:hypothetical protein